MLLSSTALSTLDLRWISASLSGCAGWKAAFYSAVSKGLLGLSCVVKYRVIEGQIYFFQENPRGLHFRLCSLG